MDNLFYAPPTDFEHDHWVELKGQEAQHVSRVLRNKVGDEIRVANGKGDIYFCELTELNRNSVIAKCGTFTSAPEPLIKKVLALGAIKKRDRLEFAIEKAVELGAWEIVLFNADHSERNRINPDRIETQIISAFKQSGRYWLPELKFFDSIDDVYSHYEGADLIMAHVEAETKQKPSELKEGINVLLVGPEGGFSAREKELHLTKGGNLVSLGENRLRAETAVVAFLSQYIFS